MRCVPFARLILVVFLAYRERERCVFLCVLHLQRPFSIPIDSGDISNVRCPVFDDLLSWLSGYAPLVRVLYAAVLSLCAVDM